MAERGLFLKDGKLVALPVAAGALIELGNLAAIDTATGYLVTASGGSGLVVVGVASETVDNTQGQDGDVTARILRNQSFLLENFDLTQADVGQDVYVYDGVTVKTGPGNVAGKLLAIDAEGPQVWIG